MADVVGGKSEFSYSFGTIIKNWAGLEGSSRLSQESKNEGLLRARTKKRSRSVINCNVNAAL